MKEVFHKKAGLWRAPSFSEAASNDARHRDGKKDRCFGGPKYRLPRDRTSPTSPTNER